jgi:hypothetical protein
MKNRKTEELNMKLIAGKNDSGKTRELIKHSLDTDIPIFALCGSKANSLIAKSLSYFGKTVRIVTLNDLAQSYTGEILVDDLDSAFMLLLSDFVRTSGIVVAGATITTD